MLSARGKYLLMVDADGATDIRDLGRVEERLRAAEKGGRGIAVGSRAHMFDQEASGDAKADRKPLRILAMKAFHLLVWMLAVRGVRDTQCGFKLFGRESARLVFPCMHVERWCFDIELLFLAQRDHPRRGARQLAGD